MQQDGMANAGHGGFFWLALQEIGIFSVLDYIYLNKKSILNETTYPVFVDYPDWYFLHARGITW